MYCDQPSRLVPVPSVPLCEICPHLNHNYTFPTPSLLWFVLCGVFTKNTIAGLTVWWVLTAGVKLGNLCLVERLYFQVMASSCTSADRSCFYSLCSVCYFDFLIWVIGQTKRCAYKSPLGHCHKLANSSMCEMLLCSAFIMYYWMFASQ